METRGDDRDGVSDLVYENVDDRRSASGVRPSRADRVDDTASNSRPTRELAIQMSYGGNASPVSIGFTDQQPVGSIPRRVELLTTGTVGPESCLRYSGPR